MEVVRILRRGEGGGCNIEVRVEGVEGGGDNIEVWVEGVDVFEVWVEGGGDNIEVWVEGGGNKI